MLFEKGWEPLPFMIKNLQELNTYIDWSTVAPSRLFFDDELDSARFQFVQECDGVLWVEDSSEFGIVSSFSHLVWQLGRCHWDKISGNIMWCITRRWNFIQKSQSSVSLNIKKKRVLYIKKPMEVKNKKNGLPCKRH